jgi:alkylated DNA repair dioxygenase AlkB
LVEDNGETYNSCLLNLYHDGNEGMAWHSDAESQEKWRIASMSFELIVFAFKHKESKETVSRILKKRKPAGHEG